jgi:D-galactarolactone cycloisomerase
MVITDIRAHVFEAVLSQPFAYSRAWYDTRTAMVVEIETDQGLIGWRMLRSCADHCCRR